MKGRGAIRTHCHKVGAFRQLVAAVMMPTVSGRTVSNNAPTTGDNTDIISRLENSNGAHFVQKIARES
ncbi:hypothetical protein SA5R_02150 [Pantoea dispersa]|uniref:Uncharacterized protein n=1 Tax=Pantoea dispersa TaxID=59814 RepID=A0A8E1V9R6_9GAMM|nr:hypothetical protein SA2_15350 [Pantoea dispersa]KTS64212.1 hypothetical protein SA5R_02150 [Pantoea dispersa]KTS67814.1 hypothetical protein SA3R_10805 [Pantoea dispersa]